jgi:hypothetical protein
LARAHRPAVNADGVGAVMRCQETRADAVIGGTLDAMAEESTRPPGRRWPWRRPSRERVPAGEVPYDDGWDDFGDDGSAGVREPRHPKPLGPMSGAGERPIAEEPLTASLPDPRH